MAVEICAIMAFTLKLAATSMEPFIVGGNFTKIEDFAHSALIAIDCNEGYYTCGGSIVNHLILLSAAHCLEDCSNDSKVFVHVGHERMNRGQTIRIAKFVTHYEYDTVTVTNDVALLRVEEPLQFGKNVRRVCLMEKPPYRDSLATVAGWGLVDEINLIGTQMLKYTRQQVWSRASCTSVLPSIPDGTFCAGIQNDQSYASEGDSGSALVVKDFIQIGLVSFKNPRVSRSVVVYTDVGHFYSWIQRRAKALYCLELNTLAATAMDPYVVGGNFTKIEHFAHSALVAIDCDDGYYTCGGSIVNHLILLSAAHCLEDCGNDSKVFVQVGHESMNKGQVVIVAKFVMHYDYDSVTVTNDIALLRVKKPLQFGKNVRRVSLMEKPPYRDSLATVAGWGLVDEINRESTQKLKYTRQKVWSRDNCTSVLLLPYIPEGTLCAGIQNDQNYASEGDSGSALIVKGFIQIGLVSFKNPLVSRSVVVYTDVGHFYSWIQRRAKSLYCLE